MQASVQACQGQQDDMSEGSKSVLLQVYRARLRATGEEVAVKVQRPDALSTISKVSNDVSSQMLSRMAWHGCT